MSRIGKLPIDIPEEVTVNITGLKVTVKGPKGELVVDIRPEMEAKVEEGRIIVAVKEETKESKAFWGLTRALIANMVKGVTEGYEKKLQLVGVGYRAKQNGPDAITLTVGFSHPVEFKAALGVELKVVDTQNITISGIDKQLVGLTAANIRKIRKPEPYKGKGIRYENEVVRRKSGKAGKVGTGA